MEKAVVGAFYRLVVDCNSVHDRYGGQLEGLALSGMGHVTDTLWNAYLPRYLSIYLSIYLYIYQYIYLYIYQYIYLSIYLTTCPGWSTLRSW